ncbi:MAG: hypothetical protein ACKPAH_10630, partial [Verrucomicrobiota bacterium]
MAVNANELRKGQAIQYNSDICVVLEVTHRGRIKTPKKDGSVSDRGPVETLEGWLEDVADLGIT